MQDAWTNQSLNTPEKAAAFRDAYQADVYAKAYALTRSEDGAAALTDRVFGMMEQRFATRTLPLNCLTYLKGQTTLLHTQGGAVHPALEAPAQPAPKAYRVQHVVKASPVEAVIAAEPMPEPAPAPEIPTPADNPAAAVVAPTREETLFDEDKTALWMPGESFDFAKHTEAQEAFRAKPKDTSNKRSNKLTVLNTFLFLATVAAAVFLLYELDLLPRLF
ncbi:MAG: hypothetical protein J6M20_02060 [Clostridia bacterium]|nr:hypothetical protein [Clostridia bacterium]